MDLGRGRKIHFWERYLIRGSPWKVLNIIKSQIEHKSNQQEGKCNLYLLQGTLLNRPAPNSFEQRKQNMAPIQGRDREQIKDGHVHVKRYTEAKCHLPTFWSHKT